MTKVHILKKIRVTKNAQNVSFGTLVSTEISGSMPPTPIELVRAFFASRGGFIVGLL